MTTTKKTGRTMNAADKQARVATPSTPNAARRDSVVRATKTVSAKTSIDFVRSVRKG